MINYDYYYYNNNVNEKFHLGASKRTPSVRVRRALLRDEDKQVRVDRRV